MIIVHCLDHASQDYYQMHLSDDVIQIEFE